VASSQPDRNGAYLLLHGE
jgi:hypothetical protein